MKCGRGNNNKKVTYLWSAINYRPIKISSKGVENHRLLFFVEPKNILGTH